MTAGEGRRGTRERASTETTSTWPSKQLIGYVRGDVKFVLLMKLWLRAQATLRFDKSDSAERRFKKIDATCSEMAREARQRCFEETVRLRLSRNLSQITAWTAILRPQLLATRSRLELAGKLSL